jgi:rare lipoprotein A
MPYSCLFIRQLPYQAQSKGRLSLKKTLTRASLLMPILFVAACNTTTDPTETGSISTKAIETGREMQRGQASWYGPGFHGRRTASGERFNSYDMTAAHRSLPFGTRLRVVNETNGRSVVVRVNDRGPFAHRRIIDLAKGPAQQLGLTSAGTAYVSLHRLD